MNEIRRAYNRYWRTNANLLGAAGQPAPLANFKGFNTVDTAGDVSPNDTGIRHVRVPRWLGRNLISDNRYARRSAQRTISHEWRHVLQNASLYYESRNLPHDEQPIEADANQFEGLVGQRTKIQGQLKAAVKAGEQKRANRLRRKQRRLPAIDNSNISENLGIDPTTIRYPGT